RAFGTARDGASRARERDRNIAGHGHQWMHREGFMRRQRRQGQQAGAMTHQRPWLDRPGGVGDGRVGYAQEHDPRTIASRASPQRASYAQLGAEHCRGEGAAKPAGADYDYARVRQRIHAGKIASAMTQPRMRWGRGWGWLREP